MIIKRLELSRPIVGIVGAAGSMGTICSNFIAKEGVKNLLLVDVPRKENILNSIKATLTYETPDLKVDISTSLESLKLADVIITVTNASHAIIKSEHLKAGAVVIDDAQPANVSEDILNNRSDIIILKVLAHIPEINYDFDFGLPHKDEVFTCLAETLALASVNWEGNFTIGPPNFDQINIISKIAEDSGFSVSKFTTFNRHIADEEFTKLINVRNEMVNV